MRIVNEIWVTKYALTKGVFRLSGGGFEVAEFDDRSPGSVTVPAWCYDKFLVWMFFKDEWRSTEEEALAHVEVMKERQRASLEKKLKALDDKKVKIIDLSQP